MYSYARTHRARYIVPWLESCDTGFALLVWGERRLRPLGRDKHAWVLSKEEGDKTIKWAESPPRLLACSGASDFARLSGGRGLDDRHVQCPPADGICSSGLGGGLAFQNIASDGRA